MFWNNWMGLADATYAIQVQKGAGGSMLSDNSVGGTINIITSTTTAEPRIDGGAHVTDYGGYTSYGSVYMKAKRQYVAGMYLVNSGAGFLPAWLPGFRFL